MWWAGMCDKPLPEGTRWAHAQLCIAQAHYMCLSCLTKTRQLRVHTMMCRAGDTRNPAISHAHQSEWGRCTSIEHSNHLDTFIWVVCGSCESKNSHQKRIMCWKVIGLHAQKYTNHSKLNNHNDKVRENLHFDNEHDIHVSSEDYEANGYKHRLDSVIILH